MSHKRSPGPSILVPGERQVTLDLSFIASPPQSLELNSKRPGHISLSITESVRVAIRLLTRAPSS